MNKISLKIKILFFVLIILINGLIYYPSLYHGPKADHNLFLTETFSFHSLKDLVTHTYSYTRTRALSPGDKILFRPLFYTVLSFEKWLYEYHFLYWQLTGLILHLILIWQLTKILWSIYPGCFVFLIALNFSVLHISQEMVIWHHITPYLITLILILKALQQFIDYLDRQYTQRFRLWRIAMYLMIGSLIYEFALAADLILISFFIIYRKSNQKINSKNSELFREARILCIPIVVYVAWSVGDYLLHAGIKSVSLITNHFAHINLIQSCLQIVSLTLAGPWVPLFLPMKPESLHGRLELQALSFKEILGRFEGNHIFQDLNLGLLILLTVIIILYVIRGIKLFSKFKDEFLIKDNKFFLGFVSLALFSSYAILFVIGRFYMRQENYFIWGHYHFYALILFSTIFIYYIFSHLRFLWQKDLAILITIALGLSIFLNGYKTFFINQDIREIAQRQKVPWERYYLSLQYNAKGSTFLNEGQYELALAYYNKSLELNPNSVGFHDNKAELFVKRKQYDLAVEEYSQLLKIDPRNAEGYANRGYAYYLQGKYPLALVDYNQAITVDPRISVAYTRKAQVYFDLGRYQQAERDLKEGLSVDPNFPYTYNELGNLYFHLKQYSLALDYYDQAVKINPRFAESYHNKAVIYSLQEQYPLALKFFDQAIEYDVHNSDTFKNRGNVYGLMKQYGLALRDFAEAIRLDPQNASVYYNRSLTYKDLQQYPLALRDAQKAKSLGYASIDEYMQELSKLILKK